MMSITKLLKLFPDEQSAVDYLINNSPQGQLACPHCGGVEAWQLSSKNQPYKCKACKKKFSIKTNTIMDGSNLPIRTWLLAIYILSTSKKGVSSIQLANMIGVQQRTAWYMAHRIRQACFDDSPLSGVVEVDETYIGGLDSNRHLSQRGFGSGIRNKIAVIGFKQRGGQTKAQVVQDTGKKTLQDVVASHVLPGSTIMTDQHASYVGLNQKGYKHQSVNHSKNEYVKNKTIHTNSIENFWSNLKRGINGNFHHLSKQHLQKYVNEFAFRDSQTDFFVAVCQNVSKGVKIRYKDLINNK